MTQQTAYPAVFTRDELIDRINDRHVSQTLRAMRKIRRDRKEKLLNRLRGIR